MNKRLLWWFVILTLALVSFIFPAKAETTWGFQIVIDPVTKKISIITGTGDIWSWTTTTWSTATWSTTTWSTSTGTIEDVWSGTAENTATYTGTEFQQALAWMYDNGLTMYDNEENFRPEDWLTREEAAKMIGQAFVTLWYEQTTKNTACTFIDANTIDPTLSGYVENTCKRGIFKGTTDNRFMPTQKLTRPQAMALLVRIFEGKVSNESKVPRWGEYYVKGQALGLTTLNSQTLFDTSITRREMAIYIYRFRNIVTNETMKLMMLSRLADIWTTGQSISSWILDSFWTLADSLSINNDPELLEAIRRMNDNGLTNFKTIAEYRPFEILNREQAAKIITLFANIFGFGTSTSGALPNECIFKDISDADGSLMTYVETACAMGIMKWSNGYFTPKGTINKSQFIASIIRLFEGKVLDETTTPRWKNYFEKAQDLGMIGPADAVTFENPITRYEVALFLYRFKVKYQILQNMNSDLVQNQVVSTVPWSIRTGTNNLPESNVYVDMNLLQNGNFNIGYIEILWQRYKVVRSNIKEYFDNNFQWFWDVFSLDEEKKIWTTSFIVSNLSLIEGIIRINDSTFSINPISNTNAYYKINQTK